MVAVPERNERNENTYKDVSNLMASDTHEAGHEEVQSKTKTGALAGGQRALAGVGDRLSRRLVSSWLGGSRLPSFMTVWVL